MDDLKHTTAEGRVNIASLRLREHGWQPSEALTHIVFQPMADLVTKSY